MPRKNKTAATVAENREAQRRSRARRQELIADLQRQLEEYKQVGVAASVEMQRVAQAVNVQNQRLKSLLCTYGVSEHEIERYLSSPNEDHQASDARHRCIICGHLVPEISLGPMSADGLSQSSTWSAAPGRARGAVPVLSNPTLPASSELPIDSMPIPREENKVVFAPPAEEPGFHQQMHSTNGLDNIAADSPSAPNNAPSPLSDSFSPSDSDIRHLNRSEPLETSCDNAAKILVELHNHADSSWARTALGCYGNSSCYVKNTKIFELMDHLD
ncbi:hypothetical protein FSPOR_2696 [Fusarium sporotrichioides]|uniref:BZIP domain-containing protein n=1 Tax=Fusarium sporotrichioides TaxID=5514 RepID=A0A395SJX4_FUSSP|nr:hypothetical protein FSPOR_2696 [Fusarium sporotrichioides]